MTHNPTLRNLAEAIHRVRNHSGTDVKHEAVPHPHAMDTAFAESIMAVLETMHEHEWQPAGVTGQAYAGGSITYVWGMCKCGEIMLRQWDS